MPLLPMLPSFGTNLPQIMTHIWQKAFFKYALAVEEIMEIYSNQVDEAIRIMKEVAMWGRNKGFRI